MQGPWADGVILFNAIELVYFNEVILNAFYIANYNLKSIKPVILIDSPLL